VHAMCLLLVPDVIAAWETHCQNDPGHSLHLTTGFLHHLGLFLCLFEDWLDIADQDMEYCQAFIAYNKTDASGWQSKSGHIFAACTSAQITFKAKVSSWETDLTRMFSLQSIHSMGYHFDKAFAFNTPAFLIQCPLPAIVNPK